MSVNKIVLVRNAVSGFPHPTANIILSDDDLGTRVVGEWDYHDCNELKRYAEGAHSNQVQGAINRLIERTDILEGRRVGFKVVGPPYLDNDQLCFELSWRSNRKVSRVALCYLRDVVSNAVVKAVFDAVRQLPDDDVEKPQLLRMCHERYCPDDEPFGFCEGEFESPEEQRIVGRCPEYIRTAYLNRDSGCVQRKMALLTSESLTVQDIAELNRLPKSQEALFLLSFQMCMAAYHSFQYPLVERKSSGRLGDGLFAIRSIRAGQCICAYLGVLKIVHKRVALTKAVGLVNGFRVVRRPNSLMVYDGGDSLVRDWMETMWRNDHPDPEFEFPHIWGDGAVANGVCADELEYANCELDVIGGVMWLKATRPINQGEEVRWFYGGTFGNAFAPNSLVSCAGGLVPGVVFVQAASGVGTKLIGPIEPYDDHKVCIDLEDTRYGCPALDVFVSAGIYLPQYRHGECFNQSQNKPQADVVIDDGMLFMSHTEGEVFSMNNSIET